MSTSFQKRAAGPRDDGVGVGVRSRPRHSSRQLTFDSEKDKREFFLKSFEKIMKNASFKKLLKKCHSLNLTVGYKTSH